MTKSSKDKKGASANKNKFKADDKVFAMDGGDLYEAKVRFELHTDQSHDSKVESAAATVCCISCPGVFPG